MKRLLRKFFPPKADADRGKLRNRKTGHRPMILSFDGRVVRLHLPE
jgi:hypothetical protein